MRMLVCLLALLVAEVCQAQNYPTRPVRMVVPFAPAGPVDVVGRIIAQKLSEALGQQVYVENHGGGSGNLGTVLSAKGQPHRYTLLAISPTPGVNPSLFSEIPHYVNKELIPGALLGT